jgi:hypothetical protein
MRGEGGEFEKKGEKTNNQGSIPTLGFMNKNQTNNQ